MRWIEFIRHTAANSFNENKTICLSSNLKNSYISMIESAVKAAAEKLGYTLHAFDRKESTESQVYCAQKRGSQAIIVILDDPNDAANILEVAKKMKIVFLATEPSDLSILNENAVFIGPDKSMVGKLQGLWLANYFKQKGQNKIKYMLLQSMLGVPAVQTQSALLELSKENILVTETAGLTVTSFSREEAKVQIIPFLESDICFDAIISDHDAIALGAIDAMEYLGMDPKKVAIVSVNATLPTREAIRNGKLLMTVFQEPKEQGVASVMAIANMLEGKPFIEGLEYNPQKDNPYAINILPDIITKTLVPENVSYLEDS